MQGPFNIVAPEIASVGQSKIAYFQRYEEQWFINIIYNSSTLFSLILLAVIALLFTECRFMVILLGLTCCAISYFNWYRDCRVFKVVTFLPTESLNDDSNFSETLVIIFEDLVGVDSIANETLFDDDFVEKYETIAFGGHSFKKLDLDAEQNDREQCIEYDEAFPRDDDEEFHYGLIGFLAFLTPILGLVGTFLASIEMLFFVFYPSVILGSICLALAACTELIWLLMFAVDLRYW